MIYESMEVGIDAYMGSSSFSLKRKMKSESWIHALENFSFNNVYHTVVS